MKWNEVARWKEIERSNALNSFISIYICFKLKLDFMKKYELPHRKYYQLAVTDVR